MLKRQREEQLAKTRQSLSLCRDMGLPKETLKELLNAVYKEGNQC
jgi:hypothetical protein